MNYQIMNDWRIFPRIFSVLFGYLLFDVWAWFKEIPDPTNTQSAFGVAMLTAAAAWFKFYVESGKHDT